MSKTEDKLYGAGDLLRLMLEYGLLCPQTTWRVSDAPDDPPRHIRFQRMTSLVRALQLADDASQVVSGAFLKHATPELHAQIIERIASAFPYERFDELMAPGKRQRLSERPGGHGFDVAASFEMLYRCRTAYYEAQQVGIDVLHAPYPLIVLGLNTIRDLEARTNEFVGTLDALLCFFIDPNARTFTQAELVADHGWSADDLDSIHFAFI